MRIIDSIKAGTKSRKEILTLHKNALTKLNSDPNNVQAKELISFIESYIIPKLSRRYSFVAFKPFGSVEDAQDK